MKDVKNPYLYAGHREYFDYAAPTVESNVPSIDYIIRPKLRLTNPTLQVPYKRNKTDDCAYHKKFIKNIRDESSCQMPNLFDKNKVAVNEIDKSSMKQKNLDEKTDVPNLPMLKPPSGKCDNFPKRHCYKRLRYGQYKKIDTKKEDNKRNRTFIKYKGEIRYNDEIYE